MITLNDTEHDFLVNVVDAARSLLDNVHCYETDEFNDLKIAEHILCGYSLKEAQAIEDGEDEDE